MIEVIPFKPEHPKMLENPRNDGEVLGLPGVDDYLQLLPQSGPAFSGVMDGRLVGCAGVVMLSEDSGQVWMMADHYMDDYPVELHRTMKAAMNVAHDVYGLNRIEAMVPPEAPEMWKRWMVRLGFVFEKIREKFGPFQKDYELYAKTWR
jgi:hypothetical protein